jgi:D-alanyl-D-alanine carboxypeptidase/D-alanyl-D-alanine-endopeptidase (penicillin-binding protein 4)
MASFVAAVTRTQVSEAWCASLPVLGVDGDLAGRETSSPLRGRVRAKTGLITGARGLVGILEKRDGTLVAFALFANDYSKSWTAVDADFDALLRAFFDEERPTSPTV